MVKIYSYVLKSDVGAAPNPFWGTCTLTICKPAIRRTAEKGDWVVGTGSKNARLKNGTVYDLSKYLVCAMKVSNKMSLEEYDYFCRHNIPNKIPKLKSKNWKLWVGDCIYDYSKGEKPRIRDGVHKQKNLKKDLSGEYSLLSKHFYYFGEKAILIPIRLRKLIKHSQGHLKIEEEELVKKFTKWINTFKKNNIYGEPQHRFIPEKTNMVNCSARDQEDDKIDKISC